MTKRLNHLRFLLAHLLSLVLFVSAIGQTPIEITLKNSFIEKFKNRATIEATFTVDKAHKKINPPSKDGDMHIAGRAPEIGLATVAEIMNAKTTKPSVTFIQSIAGTATTTKLTGAWRLWCEHSGGDPQIQGATLEPFDTTNPDHVFEIHPIVMVNGTSLVDSLIPIEGFQTKDAERAFNNYERTDLTIVPGKKTTKLLTEMGGFNYVEFAVKLNENPTFATGDGRMVFASIHDLEGDLLVRNRRLVFIKDSPPELRVKSLKKGDTLHVLGVPRINLALVSWRSKNFKKRPGALTWNLPYEMIIVGVYEDTPEIE
jgi:hypothetical protein